jgi:hypothetical protein
MGTPCLILIYESRVDEAGTQYQIPVVAIQRTKDGQQAYDKALEMADCAMITNGTYEGKPENVHNGVGRFAIALLDAIKAGWEDCTLLVPVLDVTTPLGEPDPDAIDDDELSLVIWCQDGLSMPDGAVHHSGY